MANGRLDGKLLWVHAMHYAYEGKELPAPDKADWNQYRPEGQQENRFPSKVSEGFFRDKQVQKGAFKRAPAEKIKQRASRSKRKVVNMIVGSGATIGSAALATSTAGSSEVLTGGSAIKAFMRSFAG